MDVLRTPDERFAGLPDWPYEPTYVEADGLRIAVVDEGPRDAEPVVLLHGEPSWSYLYRSMIGPLVAAGHRVVAPDLVGFGRSDKPAAVGDHTYARHVAWTWGALRGLGLERMTLFCQDWGGLIGLRLVGEHPDAFRAVVAANTGLPSGEQRLPDAWWTFRDWVARTPELPVGFLIDASTLRTLSEDEKAAYQAPFPDASFQAGPHAMPDLIPQAPDAPGAAENQAAWATLTELDLPFVCAFSDSDPITAGGDRAMRAHFRGAQGREHPTVHGGHFLQEDAGPELARLIDEVVRGA